MAVQKFVFRETWVGSKVVACMKTTFFTIFDTIWTHIMVPRDPYKEFLKQNVSIQQIGKTEVMLLSIL